MAHPLPLLRWAAGAAGPLAGGPYFPALARRGHEVRIVSFEKPADLPARGEGSLHEELAADGIGWTPLRYHKRPTAPTTAWDLAAGSIVACLRARGGRTDVVHGRSYVGGLLALAAKRAAGVPFVFEMRGFWVAERVDGGLWAPGERWCARRDAPSGGCSMLPTRSSSRAMREWSASAGSRNGSPRTPSSCSRARPRT